MIRLRTLTIAVFALLLAAGCSKEKDNMIANLQKHITNLEEQITAKESGARQFLADLEKATERADSLQLVADSLTVLATEHPALKASLDSTLHECQLLQARLEGCVAFNQQTAAGLAASTTRADSLEEILKVSTEKAARLKHVSDSLGTHLDNCRQWRNYYKSGSQQGWLEKLAGTGRMEKPPVPELD